MDARQQQRAFNWLLARGYPTAAPIMFRALWLSAAKATKAVPVISVILFYFYKNAQGCQSGIHRIIDVGCLAVRKMQKNIVQTLKQPYDIKSGFDVQTNLAHIYIIPKQVILAIVPSQIMPGAAVAAIFQNGRYLRN